MGVPREQMELLGLNTGETKKELLPMTFFSMLFYHLYRKKRKSKSQQTASTAHSADQLAHRPQIDSLEDRWMPSCNTISGHVYEDLNNNGVFDVGETVIANSEIELQDAAGNVIATTTTDANGYYEFTEDPTLDQSITTLEHAVTIPEMLAGFSVTRSVAQFDPDLGELVEVEIITNGEITSAIEAENTSTMVTSGITGLVSGTMTLSGPGFNLRSIVQENAGSFNASAFDGVLDFAGTSGETFDPKTAVAPTESVQLTGNQLLAFIGTGEVDLTKTVEVNSSATGGGNLLVGINSTAEANFVVRYKYIPKNCLQPGEYTIVQKDQPPGLMDGQESRNGTPIPNSVGTDTIGVTLTDTDITGNNFGETPPASLAGNVYFDQNGNGIRETSGSLAEPGIGGVAITLTGVNDIGESINQTVTTASNGAYKFDNLRPGTYRITEQQPSNFLDGRDTIGTQGGAVGDDEFSNINLQAGVQGVENNFGEVQRSSLSGFVYHDVDNDGSKDSGEAGIAGVMVELSGTDEFGTSVSRTITTGSDGHYVFEDLRAGVYTIREVQQPATFLDGKDTIGTPGGIASNDRFSNIMLGQGVTGMNNNFGEIKDSSLSGHVWEDNNNNGFRDPGEAGIAGTAITLTGSDDQGTVNRTTTTDADGGYSFDNLRPGNYTIRETQPTGFLDGKDNVGIPSGILGNDQISNINLPQGVDGINHDFGELEPSSLSGRVWVDDNDNGNLDAGESPIAGVLISLTGTDDLGNVVNRTMTTDSTGSYRFDNLRPGTYNLAETQPPEFLDGKDSVGTAGGSVTNDRINNIVLEGGVDGINNDFGELRPASLSGFVYRDSNDDGIRGISEQGLAGVIVRLTGTSRNGPVDLTTLTLADGSYRFENLAPGTYTLTETQPQGFLDGKDTIGTPGGTTSNDRFSNIQLQSGVDGTENNFGERGQTSISGFVYNDVNNNGVKDPGEPGIQGAEVRLNWSTSDGAFTLTETTDANGAYSFEGLLPGTYNIREEQPTGYLDGQESLGSQGGIVENDHFRNVQVDDGEAGMNYNFGELLPSSLAGTVYEDLNDNGFQDAGEQGIGGVEIRLTGTAQDGSVNTTVTTAPNGSYRFDNLAPGTYSIQESQPAGYADGKDTIGTPGGTTTNDRFSNIQLQQGVNGVNNNFGENPFGTLSGWVFEDVNSNGIRDAGEPGIGGVRVDLTGLAGPGESVARTTTTNVDGSYSFDQLAPGTYALRETQPVDFVDGQDRVGSLGGTASNDFLSNIVLGGGQSGTDYNFGEERSGGLSGFVYEDSNDNGVKDVGENGIAGVRLDLTGVTNNGQSVSRTVTTNANGSYHFADLAPGTYTITETQPPEYIDGQDRAGSLGGIAGNDVIRSISLGASQLGTDYNFGELRQGGLSGFVYEDSNGNGIKDSAEAGIAGVRVDLTGLTNSGNSVNRTTTTGSDGSYRFEGLVPGTYTITETQPTDYVDGQDRAGSLGGVAGNDVINSIPLTSGQMGTDYNFGEQRIGSLSGFVYEDVNGNGTKDAGENGIAGTQVDLTGVTNNGTSVTQTTITNADGSYQFQDLAPGTYTITETQPAGFLDGQDRAGSLGGVAGNDVINSIPLAAGQMGTDYNFGEVREGGLSGFVYEDANGNGVKDVSDSGIAGVRVDLSGTTTTGVTVTRTTTTGADGSYRFENLAPGTYAITETQPTGFVDGQDQVGSLGGNLGNDVINAITVTSGQMGTNYNFGEERVGSLSGFVYADSNGNGIKDAGESGISGVQIDLTGTTTNGIPVTQTTFTATDGSYSFTDLSAGTYTILETQPSEYADGQESLGSLGGSVANDVFSGVVLGPGQNGIDYNFGELEATDVEITKTGNPDPVLAGGTVTWTLTVTNNGPGVAQGIEVVDTLPAGMTFVAADIPDGWTTENNGQAVIFRTNSLAVAQSATITFTTVAPLDAGDYQNNVVVTMTTIDTNPDNNEASDVVTVPPTVVSGPVDPVHDCTSLIVTSHTHTWQGMLRAMLGM